MPPDSVLPPLPKQPLLPRADTPNYQAALNLELVKLFRSISLHLEAIEARLKKIEELP